MSTRVEYTCDVCNQRRSYVEGHIDEGHVPDGAVTTVTICGPVGGIEAVNHACTKTCLNKLLRRLAKDCEL